MPEIVEASADESLKDYHLTIRVKNNRIVRRIADRGYESVAGFCRAFDLPYNSVVELICMRKGALDKSGFWRSLVSRLADALNVNPEDLFNGKQARGEINGAVFTREIDEPPRLSLGDLEIAALPDYSAQNQIEAKKTAQFAMKCLTPRQREVIEARMADVTLDEIGVSLNLSREQIRNIELAALEKMRLHLHRSEKSADLRRIQTHFNCVRRYDLGLQKDGKVRTVFEYEGKRYVVDMRREDLQGSDKNRFLREKQSLKFLRWPRTDIRTIEPGAEQFAAKLTGCVVLIEDK